jgi:hypothetical protein
MWWWWRSSQSFAVFDMNANSWIVNKQIAVPADDYQYLIADSDDLNLRRSLFLISLNNIIYIEYAHTTTMSCDR